MERKTLLLDLLRQSHEMEMDFVDTLSGEERARIGTLEDWSAKDVISHILAWKARMADNLLAVSEGRSPTEVKDLDHENAIIFEAHHDKTWDDVLRMAVGASQSLVAQVEALGQQELASRERLPWQRERPLWRLIVGNGYVHPIAHVAEFHRNRGNREQAGRVLGEMSRSMAGLDDGLDWQGAVKYNLACHYSLLGAKAEAIRELQEALRMNPGLADWSKEDPDLDGIRGDPEYQAIYEH